MKWTVCLYAFESEAGVDLTQAGVPLQPGDRQYPGQVYVTLGMVRTNLTFERKDSTVTLLKDDQVLMNVLTDIVSEKRRATNVKPKIPATFGSTRETREKVEQRRPAVRLQRRHLFLKFILTLFVLQGVIFSLKENEGVIKSEEHGELPFETRENLSDVDFTNEDINEEVEFTVITVRFTTGGNVSESCWTLVNVPVSMGQLRVGKRAIRIKRVKEPLLLTLCGAPSSEEMDSMSTSEQKALVGSSLTKSGSKEELEPHMVLDQELYEGIVSQTIIEPKVGLWLLAGRGHFGMQ